MKKIPENIANILKNLPKTPWVYQMKDATGGVMYVGKAKNLHSRVHSYFREGQDLTMAKRKMVSQIADIEIILCATEVEALTLETNLIKHLSPKYNILMKDDKNLSYIKITKNPVPEAIRTRQKLNDGARYFGPYTQGASISVSLKNLRRIFKIRDCKMRFADINGKIEIIDRAGRGVPCMDYYIGNCPAPCLLKAENIEKHAENIQHFEKFLQGDMTAILDDLKAKMMHFAKNLEFEKAGKIKDEIVAIEMLSQKQIARDAIAWDHDIAIIYEKNEQFFIGLTKIRDGKIIAVFRHFITSKTENCTEVFEKFLARQYVGEADDLPKNIFLETPICDEILKKFFEENNILLEYPKIGKKKELLDFTKNQVREFAFKQEWESLENKTLSRKNMENVLQCLAYFVPKKWPIIFECYDISHTNGHFTYASRVFIKNGKPETSSYKRYKIKSLNDGEIDDFASHKEAMHRRTLEGILQKNFPNLIIIDWGKWQLSSAISGVCDAIFETFENEKNATEKTLENLFLQYQKKVENWEEFFLENVWKYRENQEKIAQILQDFFGIYICSIAKREEEIFVTHQKKPITFEKWTPELMVLQKARDESHRFSITANRAARDKFLKKNVLEELPWIGPVTRKKLLKIAGNIDGIRALSEDEILKIVNKKQLETLRDHGIF